MVGIWFSNEAEQVTNLNLNERMGKMEKIINKCKTRKWSLKGKITLMRMIILQQVQFLVSMIFIPKFILKQIDSMSFAYLLDSKPHKIKRSSIIAPIIIDKVGLGMLDVDSIHIAAKCSCIPRLFKW